MAYGTDRDLKGFAVLIGGDCVRGNRGLIFGVAGRRGYLEV